MVFINYFTMQFFYLLIIDLFVQTTYFNNVLLKHFIKKPINNIYKKLFVLIMKKVLIFNVFLYVKIV